MLLGERLDDDRGWFQEEWNFDKFLTQGEPITFKQSNTSVSMNGVLRGLHIQRNNPQGKLVRVTFGQIYDVMVDLRKDSPTFKQWFAVTLSGKQNAAVYVPPGCAHGFFTQSSVAIVNYLCTTTYDKISDGGIYWNDPILKIQWPFDKQDFMPTMSVKDQELSNVEDWLKQELI